MGKKNSNPLDSLKSAINTGVNKASVSYEKISDNISKTASVVVPAIRADLPIPKTVSESPPEYVQKSIPVQTQTQTQTQAQTESNLNPYEKQMDTLYLGCYSDDPSNPTMQTYLGEVSNTMECVEIGKKNNYKYVGVQQGNKCFASNNVPTSKQVDRQIYCNVGCDDINTGKCGGFFYNQVYKTSITNAPNQINLSNTSDTSNLMSEHVLNEIKQNLTIENANRIVENFIETEIDAEKINHGLGYVKCSQWDPIDSYALFTWIVIIVILLFVLVEYINNRTKTHK